MAVTDWRAGLVDYMWGALTRHAPETFGDIAPACLVRPRLDQAGWVQSVNDGIFVRLHRGDSPLCDCESGTHRY